MSLKTTKIAALACVYALFPGCSQETAESTGDSEPQEEPVRHYPTEEESAPAIAQQAEDADEDLLMEARRKRMVFKGMKKSDVIKVLGWSYDEEYAPGMMRENVDKCMFFKLKDHPSVPPGEYLVAIGYDKRVYTAHKKLLLKAGD